MPSNQSAYRQNHSTETAMLMIFNDLVSAVDTKKLSLLCLLDLSAAFDTVDHAMMLSRLEKMYGFSGRALR